jgi:hypothetical protein
MFGGFFNLCGPDKSTGTETSLKVMSEDDLRSHSCQLVDSTPSSARSKGPTIVAPSYSETNHDDDIPDLVYEQHGPRKLGKAAPEPTQTSSLQPRLAGIGIAFESVAGGALLIDSFIPGGAAEELGAQGVLLAGDELVAVDGQPVVGKQGRALAVMLIGDEGSPVRVTFRRWTDGAAAPRRAYDVTVDMVRRAPADSDRRRSAARGRST